MQWAIPEKTQGVKVMKFPSLLIKWYVHVEYPGVIQIKSSSSHVTLVFVHWKKSVIPVWGTSKHKSFMPKKYKSCLTCYIDHLLIPGIEHVRLRHKTKFWNLTLANFRHCKMYVQLLVSLTHITCQTESHAPPPAT